MNVEELEDEEIFKYWPDVKVIPTVINVVSFAETIESYTSQLDDDGVASESNIDNLYVMLDDEAFATLIVEITAVLPLGTAYKVEYVDVEDVPCIFEFL